jgi:hypothetical protein
MTWDAAKWVDPRTSPCPACGEKVEYAAGRRRCVDCRVWIHERCGVNPLRKDCRVFCNGCARKNARQIVKGVTRAINESGEPFPSLEVVVWSGWFEHDEEKISSELGIPLADVRRFAASLKKEGFWDGGKLVLPYEEDGVPQETGFQIMVSMILAALVADGQVERVGPGADPVPEAGGTEQDGKQESDEDPGGGAA